MLSDGRISTTYGQQRESGVCYDSEHTVKLLIKSHEPQGVRDPMCDRAQPLKVSMGALLNCNSSSYGDA